ncbi:MAG TPA: hypothetical protein ENK50_07875 [Sedimenticola sp.]|nr:hypothetical protein [Sedimenticola sp.]
MGRLLNLFVDICLLRAGPQQLPASRFLLLLTLLLSLVTGTLVLVEGFGLFPALAAQALDLLLLLGLMRAALIVRGMGARFLQAGTALFGSSVLINLLVMPLQLAIGDDPAASGFSELAVLLYLVLLLWSVVVMGHILRHAFEIRLAAGILLSLGYFLLVNWLVQALIPAAAQAAQLQ